jgi:flagellum-specific peptidoglycan hydrolase FlgJ
MNTRSKFPIFITFLVFFLHFSAFLNAQADPGRPDQQTGGGNFRAVAQIISDSFGAPVALIEEFIREAKALEQEEGIPATAFIGIAILESTGFTSYLYQNAKNPFGMRATKIWKGPTFVMWHEGADSHFRKYDSTRSAVRDFAAFLNSRQWFRDALVCPTDDLECFLKAMSADPVKKEPGYAADPEWGNKVRRVIKKYGLDRLK